MRSLKAPLLSVKREDLNQNEREETLKLQIKKQSTEGDGKEVIATVLGKSITADEKDELTRRIFGLLLDQFAQEHQLEPTEHEIRAFPVTNMQPPGQNSAEGMEKGDVIVDEEKHLMMREAAHQFVKSWKINSSLHKKYGGRIIFQQAGPEPIDAYLDFLKEQEKNGNFKIYDKADEA